MNLRKEIQVALNNCQPNTNRVDKIEAISQKYAEYYLSLQLLQPAVVGRSEQLFCEDDSKRICNNPMSHECCNKHHKRL